MNNIQIFNNTNFGEIRTFNHEGIWFVAKDVATALGYAKPENAVAMHVDAEDKTTTLIQGTGSNYQSKAILINESGLYSLILSSKLPKAKEFKRWVTSEVLPEIRKTGSYHSPKTYLEALKELVKSEEEKQKLALENQTMKPKAEYFDDLVDRKTLTNFRDTAKELHVQPKAFISLLLEKGFIYRDAKGQIKPYANYGEYFHLKEAKGLLSKWSGVQTMITPKGRETFRLLFNLRQ